MYAGNAVKHMLSEKSISKAVQGHLLVDAALNTIMVANAYNLPIPTDQPDQLERNTEITSDDWHAIGLPEEMELEVSPYKSQEQDLLEAGEILDHLMRNPGITADFFLFRGSLKNC